MIRESAFACLLLVSAASSAEIEKNSRMGEKGMNLYWWPKLSTAPGWVQDKESSYANSMNILVPKGLTFSNAPTVIYGRASFRPGKTLAKFIADDRAEALKEISEKSADAGPVLIANGQKVKSVEFTPTKKGNWERVAYLSEGEYICIFTLSSRTQKDYMAKLPVFLSVLKKYKR